MAVAVSLPPRLEESPFPAVRYVGCSPVSRGNTKGRGAPGKASTALLANHRRRLSAPTSGETGVVGVMETPEQVALVGLFLVGAGLCHAVGADIWAAVKRQLAHRNRR